MKIKSDFVTNSSSTSFIITCKAEAIGKDDFIDKYNGMLKVYIKMRAWDEEFREPPLLTSDRVTHIASDTFVIQDFVPIYFNDEDEPQYIHKLLLNSDPEVTKLLKQAGITLITMQTKDLNES